MTIASITILGRLGKDPESTATSAGKSVTRFSLAVNDGTKDAPHTTWFRCNAWEQTGATIQRFFKKGDLILVMGGVASRQWTDGDGNLREAQEVTVRQWSFASSKEGADHATRAPADVGGYRAPDLDENVPF